MRVNPLLSSERCKEMPTYKKAFNKRVYIVYVYTFLDNTAYVGLTKQLQERHKEHNRMKRGKYDTVKQHAIDLGIDLPNPIILEENLTAEEAQEKEGYWVDKFKEDGINVLNKAKTGKESSSLGGVNRKWTYEVCYSEAKKYDYKRNFYNACKGGYTMSKRHGWLSDYTWLKDFENKKEIKRKKLHDTFLETAKLYQYIEDFRAENQSSYYSAKRYGWFEEADWLTHNPNYVRTRKKRTNRPSACYDANGNLINTWDSVMDMANGLGISYSIVSNCLRQKLIYHNEYIFNYKNNELGDLFAYRNVDKKNKPIRQYTTQGELVREYNNLKEVACQLPTFNPGVILASLNNKSLTSYGSIWLYADDNTIQKRIERIRAFTKTYQDYTNYTYDTNHSTKVPVSQYSFDGEHLKDFTSIKEAARELGISSSHITKCLKGERLQANDSIFSSNPNLTREEVMTMGQKAIEEKERRAPKRLSLYNTDGTFIRHYESAYEMAKDLKYDAKKLRCIINGKQNTWHGMFVIKSCDNEQEIIRQKVEDLNRSKNGNDDMTSYYGNEPKSIMKCSIEDDSVIEIYPSIKQAAKSLNVTTTKTIRQAVDVPTRSAYGFRWKSATT